MGSAERRENPFNKWRRDNAISSLKLYDRFSREVGKGDAVMILGKWDVSWRVADVQLMFPKGPNDPPAHLKVTFAAVYIAPVEGGLPTTDLVKVKDVSEMSQPNEQADGVQPVGTSAGGPQVHEDAKVPPSAPSEDRRVFGEPIDRSEDAKRIPSEEPKA